MIRSELAAVLSVILCLLLLSVYVTAAYDLLPEPPFARLLTVDGVRPSSLGRVVMLGMLLSWPAAFLIDLLPMLTRAGPGQPTPFKPTRAHTLIGTSVLVLVLVTMRHGVLYELRPFVDPLGSASILGQILFFLLLLALPAAFLLHRLPRPAGAGSRSGLTFQPTSINLIVGAAILMMILMVTSAFLLETVACAIGVPNCD